MKKLNLGSFDCLIRRSLLLWCRTLRLGGLLLLRISWFSHAGDVLQCRLTSVLNLNDSFVLFTFRKLLARSRDNQNSIRRETRGKFVNFALFWHQVLPGELTRNPTMLIFLFFVFSFDYHVLPNNLDVDFFGFKLLDIEGNLK